MPGSRWRCGSRAYGSRLPSAAGQDAVGWRRPTCVRLDAGARQAASPESRRTHHPTAAAGSPEIVPRATAGRVVADPAHLAAQHCVLVPEHQQFGVLGRLTPGRHQDTTEQTANEYVDHPAMTAVRRLCQIEYSSPTGSSRASAARVRAENPVIAADLGLSWDRVGRLAARASLVRALSVLIFLRFAYLAALCVFSWLALLARSDCCTAAKLVLLPDQRVRGVAYAALWFSFMTSPSTFRSWTGAPGSTTVGVQWPGGRCWRDWYGRWPL